jgi:hypothetical protein
VGICRPVPGNGFPPHPEDRLSSLSAVDLGVLSGTPFFVYNGRIMAYVISKLPRAEIIKCANGFIVRAPYDMAQDKASSWDETHVFESFNSMMSFLNDYLAD